MAKDNIRTRGKRRRALALMRAGQWREAQGLYTQITGVDRRDAQAWVTLGMINGQLGDMAGVIRCCREALALDPSQADAYFNIGRALRQQGDGDGAVAAYREAIRVDPGFYNAYYNLANVLREQGRLDEAEANYRRALAIKPEEFGALNNLGLTRWSQGFCAEAEAIFRSLLRRSPQAAEPHSNLGGVLFDEGRLEEAREHLERSLSLDPGLATAHWTHALALLVCGDFARGWEEYEWGLKIKERTPRSFSFPIWDGGSLEGRTLLIYAEQGVGDEVMFASCIPDALAQRGHCVIECDPRLAPLFERSFVGATIVGERRSEAAQNAARFSRVDVQISAGSLPRHFRRRPEAFPARPAYLCPDPMRVEAWRTRLQGLGSGLKIGVAWRGGADPRRARDRSVPLEQWGPLLGRAEVHAVNLQYGDCTEALAAAREALGVVVHSFDDVDPMTELDDFCALLAALDLVVSVDNSTVHFAGAVGTPTWVMLPKMPDWRWMFGRDDSVWYSSVRLFRQASPGDWAPVIERVAAEAAALIKQ